MKKLELLLILFGLSLLVSCATGGTGGGGGPVSVSLTPNSNPVLVGVTFTQQFTANVSGASNQSVTWSVSGSGCSGASCGAVDANGLYAAPAAPPAVRAGVERGARVQRGHVDADHRGRGARHRDHPQGRVGPVRHRRRPPGGSGCGTGSPREGWRGWGSLL